MEDVRGIEFKNKQLNSLPRTDSQTPFVIIPHTDFNETFVNNLKLIAAIANGVLIVMIWS